MAKKAWATTLTITQNDHQTEHYFFEIAITAQNLDSMSLGNACQKWITESLCHRHVLGIMNVGMPTWHPHPKNPSWPLPFTLCSGLVLFLFGRLRLRGFAALCLLLHAHVRLQSEYVGRMVQETMAPLPSS